METVIKKWGNSLAIRIPKMICRESGIQDGTEVEIAFDGNKIIVKPCKKEYSLTDLVSQINEENIHYEIQTGQARGNEIW
ncbi:MAG TPA: AbrB/MazE/SpoVT family DNA-binding domain-containing protein [Prolixibacteraceae bacterium]|nr:AbrB/MazE/SpoVT family DNA-binding domain-containing protein [Prolixibacteraceae bacterium]HPT30838.1 AbrB/MazE/SpoVT family DNA-binding domain-containing protein [Prolixibacteraceae bacterium]